MVNIVKETKDIFISYTGRDAQLAQVFCDQAEALGMTCWIAPRDINEATSWAGSIVNAIKDCKVVVFLVSEQAMASKEVAKELNLANDFEKKMLPVRIQDISLENEFAYHLGNKQWVDALENDIKIRYHPTLEAIKPYVKVSSIELQPIVSGSLLDMTNNFTEFLNKTHSKILNELMLTITYKEHKNTKEDKIIIKAPIRIGGSGADINFIFDIKNKEISINIDSTSSGENNIKPLLNIHDFSNLFAEKKLNTRNSTWNFIELLPAQKLTTSLVNDTEKNCFKLYENNVNIFFEKVYPDIFNIMKYGRFILNIIDSLEIELKKIFPDDSGWCVGAPASEHLKTLERNSKIYIYKEKWQPEDNYIEKGLLSFSLQADKSLFNDLKIGVVKFEPSLEIGELNEEIINLSENIMDLSKRPKDFWVVSENIIEPLNNSGLELYEKNEFLLENKHDEFIKYCVDKFLILKNTLVPIIDKYYKQIPELQIKSPEQCFCPTTYFSSLRNYIVIDKSLPFLRSSFKIIIEILNKKYDNELGLFNISLKQSIHYGDGDCHIYGDMIINGFNVSMYFNLYKNSKGFSSLLCASKAPYFENNLISIFLRRYFEEINFKIDKENKLIIESKKYNEIFNGKDALIFMKEYEYFIDSQIELLLPIISSLKTHLDKLIILIKKVELIVKSIFSESEGWIIENNADSLKNNNGFIIWHSSWKKNKNEKPIISFQLGSEHECFDKIYFSITMTKYHDFSDNTLGIIKGASDLIFNTQGYSNENRLWYSNIDESKCYSGGLLMNNTELNVDNEVFLTFIEDNLKLLKNLKFTIDSIYNEL